MSNVNSKNTKQEILDELTRVNEEMKTMRESCGNPVREAAVVREKEIVTSAVASVEENIFSESVNKKFADVQEAISIQSAKLEEMFGIEKELTDLALAINTVKETRATINKELQEEKEEIRRNKNAALEDMKMDIEDARKQYSKELKDLTDQRERDEQSYDYEIKRWHMIAENQYRDAQRIIEREDAYKSSQIQERLDAIAAEEEEIKNMKETIAGIDERITASYSEGRDAGEKSAAKEYGYKKALADKEHEYAVKDFTNQITSLQTAVAEKNAKIEALEAKLDSAYTKIVSVANSTVEASDRAKNQGGNQPNQSK